MFKHWAIHHGGMGNMDFKFNIVRGYQDSLSRQVGEAVRVQLRQNVLNSKSIYNRCKLTRLVVDRELLEDKNAREEDNKRDNGEQLEADITLVETGEKRQLVEVQKPGRKKAKLKHPVEGEDWGLVETDQDGTTSFLYQESNGRGTWVEGVGGHKKQSTIKVWTGNELWARRILTGVVLEAVVEGETNIIRRKEEEWKTMMEGVVEWEEWGWPETKMVEQPEHPNWLQTIGCGTAPPTPQTQKVGNSSDVDIVTDKCSRSDKASMYGQAAGEYVSTGTGVDSVNLDISGLENMGTSVDSSRMGSLANSMDTDTDIDIANTSTKCPVLTNSKENQLTFMNLLSRGKPRSTSKVIKKRKYKTKAKPTQSSERIMLEYFKLGPIKRKLDNNSNDDLITQSRSKSAKTDIIDMTGE
jgi:hypothetical protein